MDGKSHRKLYFITIIPLIALFFYFGIWYYTPLLCWAFFMIDPDDDLKSEHITHRHWIFHSILLPFFIIGSLAFPLILYYNYLEPFYGISVCLMYPSFIHLLADIKSNGKRVGTYNIRLKKHNRLSGKQTIWWLLLNALLELILMVIFLWQLLKN